MPVGWRRASGFERALPVERLLGEEPGVSHAMCAPWRAWALDTIDAIQPELTVLASADSTLVRLASGSKDDALETEVRPGTESVINHVAAVSGRTVMLAAPVHGVQLRSCAVAGALPSACATKSDFPWTALDPAQKAAAQQTGAEYLVTKPWFCSSRGTCPALVRTTPMRVDGAHLTTEFSTLLGPVLREALDLVQPPVEPAVDPDAEPVAEDATQG